MDKNKEICIVGKVSANLARDLVEKKESGQ